MAACYLLIYTGMGIAAGPNVPRDGLALWYDFSTTRSFRGEPTTNLVPGTYDYGLYAYASGPSNVTVLSETLASVAAKRYTITNVVNVARAAIYPSLSINTTYTFSLKWKYNGTNTTSPQIAITASKGNPEVNGSNSFASETLTTTAIGYGWYKSVYTFSLSASPTGGAILTHGIVTGSDSTYLNNTFDIYEVQFEVKPYATAYSVGTRGTTVATGGGVIDLSGQGSSGELVNGPTFSSSSGGILVFDGTNDYLALGANSATAFNSTTTAFSIEVSFLVPPNHSKTNPAAIFDRYRFGLYYNYSTNTAYIAYVNKGYDDTGNYSPTTQDSRPLNPKGAWNHLVVTYTRSGDSASIALYDNGSATPITASSTRISGYPLSNAYVGNSEHLSSTYYWFEGSISTLRIYQRALTPSEVVQAYNANRQRFSSVTSTVRSGLVLHLDAANRDSYRGSGTTWTDLSGYGYNGTLTNGPVFRTGNGGAIAFDGTNDYVTFGDITSTDFGIGDFTVSCWVFLPSGMVENNNFFKGIVVKKGANAANAGYGIYYNTGQKKFLWSTADGTSAYERYSTNTWVNLLDSWSNIVMVRQSGATNNGHFYVNSVIESIASSVVMCNVNNDYNLLVGGSSTLYVDYFLQGSVSLVQIYNRALSAAEVLQNYNATRARFGL